MIDRLFLAHPRSAGESYGRHLVTAVGFAAAMIGGGLACLVHALVPGLFERTGSNAISDLHHRMLCQRRNLPAERVAQDARR